MKIFILVIFSLFFINCKNQDSLNTSSILNKDSFIEEEDYRNLVNLFNELESLKGSITDFREYFPKVTDRLGNHDNRKFQCPSDNPDTDLDGICDNEDRCPGFDDKVDKDKDGSPSDCDCDDDNPDVKPGKPCENDGSDPVCYTNICDPDLTAQCIPVADPEGTVCDPVILGKCDAINTCDGNGNCIDNKKNTDVICSKKAGNCDVAEKCDGVNNDCPADAYAPVGTPCGINNLGSCDGFGQCDRVHDCPNSNDQTDNDNDKWPAGCDCNDMNSNVYPGRPCETDDKECTIDICDPELSGECLHIEEEVGRACGEAPVGACDAQNTCNSDGTCTDNVKPYPFVCRVTNGFCDNKEVCDGKNKECPTEGYKPIGTICGDPISGACDEADICDGQGSCIYKVASNGTLCRAAQDACDVSEFCDGLSAECPANMYAMAGTICGPVPTLVCDRQNTCNTNGVCIDNIAPHTTLCRESRNFICDSDEYCNGIDPDCPSDLYSPNGDTMYACSTTGYSGSCSHGTTYCNDGDAICYPSSIACTQSIIYGQSDDLLGAAVDLQGTQSILGAYGTHVDGFNSDNQGSCYMAFENSVYPPVNWSMGSQIFPSGDPDEIKRGEFGRAVGVSGNNAIIGAPRTNHKDKLINTKATGGVYFYAKDQNGVWNLNNFFDDPEVGGVETTGALFGFSVDIDGPWAIAGGPGQRSQLGNLAQGGISIFFLNPAFNVWEKTEDIKPDPNGPLNALNGFGYAVAISGDWAIISAPGQGQLQGGAVSFYYNDPQSSWINLQNFTGTTNSPPAFFGKTVDIAGDLAIVGDPGALINSVIGAVTIYRLNGQVWSEEIVISNPGNGNDFGESVAIFKNVAVVGDPTVSVNGGAYVFTYTGSDWVFKEILINDSLDYGSNTSNAQIGQAVAVDNDTILVGAPSAQLTNDEGAVLIYHYPQ